MEFPQIISPELELELDQLDLELPQDDEGDDGSAGDREPRNPNPSDLSDAMDFEVPGGSE